MMPVIILIAVMVMFSTLFQLLLHYHLERHASWHKMSHDMTKPTKWVCAQRRLRSAWAFAQSDQSSLSAWRTFWSLAKTLIRLGGCPGWSDSSLGAQSFCWFWHEAAQMLFKLHDPQKVGRQRRSCTIITLCVRPQPVCEKCPYPTSLRKLPITL